MKTLLLLIILSITTLSFSQTDTTKAVDPVLFIAEEMPSFPGGETEIYMHIARNITYPMAEKLAGISGTCYLSFVVDKEGAVKDVKVLRGVKNGPGLDAEAVRLVFIMPKWNPGKQNGKKVRVQYDFPIKFLLK